MTKEIIDFYDTVSADYSTHRYPDVTESYSQYLFKKRRDLFLSLVESIEKDIPQNATILEVGCADGVLLKALEERFPNRFSKLVGMDISPKMIEEGIKQNTNSRASFYVKENLPTETFDVVVELGIHPFNIDEELQYASEHLKSKGYFVYDLVSSQSLFAKLKLKGKYYVKDYKTYSEYDVILKKYFGVVHAHVYGLFVPKMWSFSSLARTLQPIFDTLFQKIAPQLFHEKIYLLKKND